MESKRNHGQRHNNGPETWSDNEEEEVAVDDDDEQFHQQQQQQQQPRRQSKSFLDNFTQAAG